MSNTNEKLNTSLANTMALYSKVHSFHWNVTGPRFQELHAFFETLYTNLWQQVDSIAELIRINGDMAPLGYGDGIQGASIVEEKSIPLAGEMLQILEKDFQKLIDSLKDAVETLEESRMQTSADVILGMIEQHEKNLWMIKSMQ